MSTENDNKTRPDIDLPLSSEPMTLSHRKTAVTETRSESAAAAPSEPVSAAASPATDSHSGLATGAAPATAPAAAEPEDGERQVAGKPLPAAGRVKICPKCAHRQNDFYACRHCGLVFRNWRPEMERELFSSIPDSVYAAMQEMWRGVESNWDSDETHEKFIQFCKSNNGVPYALRAYRLRAAKNPADVRSADFVRKCSEFVGGLLQLMTPQSRSAKSSSVTPGQVAVAVSIGLVLLVVVFIIFDYLLK